MEDAVSQTATMLVTYGYLIIFVWMFLDQAALPFPSIPLLVAAGALSNSGDLSIIGLVIAASAGTILADLLWYALGRYKGVSVVRQICRLALEPDTCTSATRIALSRFNTKTLLFAKYLPGIQTIAPACAGLQRTSLSVFLLFSLAGTLLFVLPFVLAGYYFQVQIVSTMSWLGDLSGNIGFVFAALVVIFLALKILRWGQFAREHRLRRLSVSDLKQKVDERDPLTIIDVRQHLDFEMLPVRIPGAILIPLGEIRKRREEIPRHHDVVLVCT